MRTKTLLLTAAAGMVGMATSFAQVYSVNAVGYVNVTVPVGGYAILGNPLNGTNNLLSTVLPLPDDAIGTAVFKFDKVTQNFVTCNFFGGGLWIPDETVNPGEGFFIQALSSSSATTLSITFVGDVPQGTLLNTLAATPLFTLASSIVPQSASLGYSDNTLTPPKSGLEFPAEVGDAVYLFDKATQQYVTHNYFGAGLWIPDPVVGVAEGFFLQKGPGSTLNSWTRDFSVN